MDIGARLKSLREAAGLSQYRLSKMAGVSQAHISEIESGKSEVTATTLSLICSALGITLAQFFAPDNQEVPPDLRQLLAEAQALTPEQRKKLTEFIRSLKGG